MTDDLKKHVRADEGMLKKGGVNTTFQITVRPPDPPPMKPQPTPPPPPPDAK